MSGSLRQAMLRSEDRHLVHLYRDSAALADAVAGWVAPPLAGEGGAILIGPAGTLAAARDRLRLHGLDVAALEAANRLVMLSADEVMASFFVGGVPDADRFDAAVGPRLSALRAACRGEVRAWGAMVDVLYQRGDEAAARRLEHLWNALLGEHDVRLLCSYALDVLDSGAYTGTLRDLCASHGALVADADTARIDAAVQAALIEIFGQAEAPSLQARLLQARPAPVPMPTAQKVLLAIHELDPGLGQRVLAATRRHYRA